MCGKKKMLVIISNTNHMKSLLSAGICDSFICPLRLPFNGRADVQIVSLMGDVEMVIAMVLC
jgi:hypothetical protein